MAAPGDEAESLRELHESYIWAVNAAVAEGREDLVWKLADEYTDRALRLIGGEHPVGCTRTGCPVCAARRAAGPPSPPRPPWWRRLFTGGRPVAR